MSTLTVAWSAFLLYLVVTTGLALASMKRTTSLRAFAIGNRDMSPVLVGITLAASVASTATFVINPGFVWANGLSALLFFGLAGGAGVIRAVALASVAGPATHFAVYFGAEGPLNPATSATLGIAVGCAIVGAGVWRARRDRKTAGRPVPSAASHA